MDAVKKFFTDMLAPSGKWSLNRVMTAAWFCVLCWFAVSNGRAFGHVLTHMFDQNAAAGSAAVPYLEEFSYFLLAVFFLLLSITFANKTGLNMWGKSGLMGSNDPNQQTNQQTGVPVNNKADGSA